MALGRRQRMPRFAQFGRKGEDPLFGARPSVRGGHQMESSRRIRAFHRGSGQLGGIRGRQGFRGFGTTTGWQSSQEVGGQ
eukprot:11170499-Lingulodinium_polyedra.AAC.1